MTVMMMIMTRLNLSPSPPLQFKSYAAYLYTESALPKKQLALFMILQHLRSASEVPTVSAAIQITLIIDALRGNFESLYIDDNCTAFKSFKNTIILSIQLSLFSLVSFFFLPLSESISVRRYIFIATTYIYMCPKW